MKAYEGVEELLHTILAKLLDLNIWSGPPTPSRPSAVYPAGNSPISHWLGLDGRHSPSGDSNKEIKYI